MDGTFLKGKTRGILLTAVGLDGNDSLFPLALGLVEKENTHHWLWFLQWLQKSLDLGNGENVTLMSDMQKVMIQLTMLSKYGTQSTRHYITLDPNCFILHR